MFGFLNPGCVGRSYRQVYARCCQNMWQREGRLSTFFHSYESVFLYALAIDLKLCSAPGAEAPTCCRLCKKGPRNCSDQDKQVADFCAGFAILLAEIKMRDDVADDRSASARVVLWWLRKSINRAHEHFLTIDSSFEDRLTCIMETHQRAERSSSSDLSDFQSATRDGFAYLFSLLGNQLALARDLKKRLLGIGGYVGAAIIAFDCAIDWPRDVRRKQANPVRSAEQAHAALLKAQQELSAAGWACSEIAGPSSLSAQVLRSRMGSLTSKKRLTLQPRTRVSSASRFRSPLLRQRSGFCDGCACGGCDCNCCDAGNSCDCVNCHCPGAECLSCNFDGCAYCLDGCVCGEENKRSRRRFARTEDPGASANANQPPRLKNMIGRIGVSVGALNPSGVVLVEGAEYPARAQSGLVEDGAQIQVVSADAFGLVVDEL